MPSTTGDGYTVVALEESGWCGPGIVVVAAGSWLVGNLRLRLGETAVLWRPVRATPDSTCERCVLGVLEYDPETPVVRGTTSVTDKPWGREVRAHPDFGLLKIIHVDAGERTSLQRHEHKDEVLIPIAGSGHVEVRRGDQVGRRRELPEHLKPGTVHRAVGPLMLVEGSTYHPDDVTRLEDDYARAQS